MIKLRKIIEIKQLGQITIEVVYQKCKDLIGLPDYEPKIRAKFGKILTKYGWNNPHPEGSISFHLGRMKKEGTLKNFYVDVDNLYKEMKNIK